MRTRHIACLAATLLLVGCGAAANTRVRNAAVANSSTVSPPVTVVATLPAGFNPPVRLAPDPAGQGLWFWANGAQEATVFSWTPGATTWRTWQLGSPADLGLETLTEGGFDIGADGIAWLGAENSLVRLDTSSGAVRHWTVPAPSDNAAAEPYQPQAGRHVVVGVASDGRGHVAIAQTAAATLTMFDASSDSFSSVSLPAAMAPSRLGYLSDGTLGVALLNYSSHTTDHVLLVDPSGNGTVAAVGAQFLHPANDDFLVGAEHLELLSPTGAVQAVPNTAAAMVGMWDAAALPSGAYVYPTQAGVSVLHSDGSRVDVDLPSSPCGGESRVPGVPGVPTPTAAPDRTCPTAPLAFVPDAVGNIWLHYLTAGRQTLGVVAAGSY